MSGQKPYQTACSWSFKAGSDLRCWMKSWTILTLSSSPGSKPLLSWRTNLSFCSEINSVSMLASPGRSCEVSYDNSISNCISVSWEAHSFFHSECLVNQWRLADTGLFEARCQHRYEIHEDVIPFLSPKFGNFVHFSISQLIALDDHPNSPRANTNYFISGGLEL
jgi:hypothetical protein